MVIANADYDTFRKEKQQQYPWLPEALLNDYTRNYGTVIDSMLANSASVADLGTHFGGDLYEAEVRHLMDNEWAQSADDVLWRRTRKGLGMPDGTQEKLAEWMQSNRKRTAAA